MVKTWHAIDTISSRISQVGTQLVRLVRGAENTACQQPAAPLDPAGATVQALAQPLDFPALSAATVAGDRVALVVDDEVPGAAGVVRGAVDALHLAGVEDDAISLVTTSSQFAEICRGELPAASAQAIHVVIHDPDDEHNLCFVGVPRKREPLLVNRAIYDADVVLPIGCARIEGRGAFDGLFPTFAGAEAVDRYRRPAGHDTAAACAEMCRETDEAGWLIGSPLVIQVVPGGGETLAYVVGGDPRSVAHRAAELCRQQWSYRSPQRSQLVVAIVTGGATMQTWRNVGRALAAAERLVADDGAIAICTNLTEPPGQSLGRLIGGDDLAVAERKIAHDEAADSWPAWRLARALQRGPVYFLSLLDDDTVEDMGLAPVADIDELVRLVSRRESCIVLNDAQYAVATVAGE